MTCYSDFQLIAIICVGILSLCPLAVIILMRKWTTESGLPPWKVALRRVFSVGFTYERLVLLLFAQGGGPGSFLFPFHSRFLVSDVSYQEC